MPVVRIGLFLFDALLAFACFAVAFRWREGEPVFAPNSFGWSDEFAPYGVLLWFVVPIRLVLLKSQNLYNLRGEFSFIDEAARVFKATAIASLLIVAAAFLYRGGFEFRAFSYSRVVFLVDFLFALVAFGALRFAVRGGQVLLRRRGINLIPTLIVGTGREAEVCIEEMRAKRELGYRVIGVVVNDELGMMNDELKAKHSSFIIPNSSFHNAPIVGRLKDLPELVRDTAANEVIITDANVSGEILFDVMMRCGRRRGVEFKLAPNLFNSLPRKTEINQIGALPMISLFREPLTPAAKILKRASDIALSLTAIILFAPVWLLIAALVKFDSKGKVFYKQKRVGMDGRTFSFYKFRTMTAGSDDGAHRKFLKEYIAGNAANQSNSADAPVFKLQNDVRVTRTGKWLRRLSLDEFPQLFNVLRGEMSVVGPRPPIPYEVEEYAVWQRRRLDMKPGITGLWQVSGRNRLTFEEMVRLDLYYIENWSLWLDLKIIFLTIPAMLRGDGAR